MNSKREQIWVGLFVLIAAGLLIGTVLAVSGAFRRGRHSAPFVFQVRRRSRARCHSAVRRYESRQGRKSARRSSRLNPNGDRLQRGA